MFNKVHNYLIRAGHNADAVAAMMEDNFDIAVKSYPEASAKFLADVVATL